MPELSGDELYAAVLQDRPDLALSPPGLAFVAFNKALELMAEQRFNQAINLLDHGISLLPNDALPRWHCAFRYNKSICYLCLGDYINGFREAEFRRVFFPHISDRVKIPIWRGEPLEGKRLLLCQEMGMGDVIMMLRYVPVLKQMGANITLMIAKPLHRLAHQFGVNVIGETVRGAGFDFKCLLMQVPAALRHTIKDVPPAPYLDQPRQALTEVSNRKKIGIAWSGNPKFSRDKERSIKLPLFLGLLAQNGCELYSLQTTQTDIAQDFGVKTPPLADFYHTARLIMAMDHIVCVDTAPIHVAGAIGHPSAHVLVHFAPEWRWYHPSVWYKTLHVHRQKQAGAWSTPFAGVCEAIG